MKALYLIGSILGVACFSMTILAAEKQKTGDAADAASHFWYDGEIRRDLYMQTPDEEDEPDAGFSPPVFHQNGHKMSLPGGVIVRFKPDWDRDTIVAWMQQQGITRYRAILSDHTWMIETAAGLPALELANTIHETGDVVYASPNWARERQLR